MMDATPVPETLCVEKECKTVDTVCSSSHDYCNVTCFSSGGAESVAVFKLVRYALAASDISSL